MASFLGACQWGWRSFAKLLPARSPVCLFNITKYCSIWFSNCCKLGPFFTSHTIFDADDGDSDDDVESEDDGYTIQVEDRGKDSEGDVKSRLSNAAAKSTRTSSMSFFFLIISESSKKAYNGPKHVYTAKEYAGLALQVFRRYHWTPHSQERLGRPTSHVCKTSHFLGYHDTLLLAIILLGSASGASRFPITVQFRERNVSSWADVLASIMDSEVVDIQVVVVLISYKPY
jgi:hypothetical protein